MSNVSVTATDGSSGEVYLARENDTGGLYALKVIPKRQLSGTLLATEIVMAERKFVLDLRGNDSFLRCALAFMTVEIITW
jgi:serine/threonine protein kinase